MEKKTRKIVHERLPEMVGVDKKNAQNEYESFVEELASVTEGKTRPLDFDVLIEAAGEETGMDGIHAHDASSNFLIDLGVVDENDEAVVVPAFRMGTGTHAMMPGTQIIVNGEGAVQSAFDVDNPRVPLIYGHRHSYPFLKIAEAAAVRAMHGDVDPTKDAGYKALTEMKRAAGMVGTDSLPHIGNSVVRDKDGNVLLGGTTGRTASPELIAAIKKYRPDLVERLLNADGDDPDNLAGLLDTMSGEVAAGVLNGSLNPEDQPNSRIVVRMPDPNSPEHSGVDWN